MKLYFFSSLGTTPKPCTGGASLSRQIKLKNVFLALEKLEVALPPSVRSEPYKATRLAISMSLRNRSLTKVCRLSCLVRHFSFKYSITSLSK
jgi:hypothetical protein